MVQGDYDTEDILQALFEINHDESKSGNKDYQNLHKLNRNVVSRAMATISSAKLEFDQGLRG